MPRRSGSAIFGPAAVGGRIARLAALPALAVAAGWGTAAAQEGCSSARCLADGLIGDIPRGERIALVPFGPPNTSIPRDVAERLHDSIKSALYQSSRRRHEFVDRRLGREIWRFYQSERDNSEYRAFWEERRVSVIVQCRDRGPAEGGLALHCVASRIGDGSKLRGDVIGPPTVLPVRGRWFSYGYALTRLGLALTSAKVEPGRVSRAAVTDRDKERETGLTRAIGQRLRAIVEERFRIRRELARRQAKGRADLGLGGDPAGPGRLDYELHGEFAWLNKDSARLDAWLLDPDRGERVSEFRVAVERDWLPETLVRREAPYFTVSARATVSGELGKAHARHAARNLARARLMTDALGAEPPPIGEIRTEADGIVALRHALQTGIPADERFREQWRDGENGWKTELRARVVKPGTIVRPALTARLASDSVRAWEPIRIELSARDSVHIAAFAWGPDGSVLRLYPHYAEPMP
ncbi:MAG: hypothetical protein OXC28_18420, partial [Defluviicoccus sp.]|nr:hypothetical protein [Defluviicoccus sp.]